MIYIVQQVPSPTAHEVLGHNVAEPQRMGIGGAAAFWLM